MYPCSTVMVITLKYATQVTRKFNVPNTSEFVVSYNVGHKFYISIFNYQLKMHYNIVSLNAHLCISILNMSLSEHSFKLFFKCEIPELGSFKLVSFFDDCTKYDDV